MITRSIAPLLRQLLQNTKEYNNVLLVEGARQVGKTTLVRQVLQDLPCAFKEFNLEEKKGLTEKIDLCEDFAEFTELAKVEMGFHPGGGDILFIDEAQESRRLGSFIRFMKEKWRHTQVVLSGSVLSRIFRDNIRYPVGRVTILHLAPFSFEEFLTAGEEHALLDTFPSLLSRRKTAAKNSHQRLLQLLDNYLTVGGLPEVVTTHFQKGDWQRVREDVLLGYYSDFKRVYGEEKQGYFIAALKAVANLLGSPFKNSHVASLLDGGKNSQIVTILAQLESWKMVFKIEQRGPKVETNFHPKRYLFDVGIAKQLRESAVPGSGLMEMEHTVGRIPLGGLIENMVLQVLAGKIPEVAGWKKSSSGSEVDFILKERGRVIPIECKAALAVKNSHLGGLRDFMRSHHVSRGILIALAPLEIRQLSKSEEVLILPLYLAQRWEEAIAGAISKR